MATMNHTNLTTYNVLALTELFCSVFGFQLIEKRADKLSVLQNAEGVLLTLMYAAILHAERLGISSLPIFT